MTGDQNHLYLFFQLNKKKIKTAIEVHQFSDISDTQKSCDQSAEEDPRSVLTGSILKGIIAINL